MMIVYWTVVDHLKSRDTADLYLRQECRLGALRTAAILRHHRSQVKRVTYLGLVVLHLETYAYIASPDSYLRGEGDYFRNLDGDPNAPRLFAEGKYGRQSAGGKFM